MNVVIVGAGLAGLACAIRLQHAGLSVQVLEAQSTPGGRIRTDLVDGFRLDHGFQLLLTGYPELPHHFDMKALRLRPFAAGALVRHGGRFHHFADPFRDSLGAALSLAFDPIITVGDKLRVAALRRRVGRGQPAALFKHPETTTHTFLENYGFSAKIIERFFTPFFAGVFLERELITSSRYFEFLFRMFALGEAAVPEQGMEMLPRQLAVQLNSGTVQTDVRVTGIRRDGDGYLLETVDGVRARAGTVVLAVDEAQARPLLGGLVGRARLPREPVQWNRTTTLYYAAERTPVDGPLLVLNGEGAAAGPVNNAVVLSQASERYAPPGAHLIAASIVGRAPRSAAQMELLERDARVQLRSWFGADVDEWSVVGGYPISQALPQCLHAEWEQTQPRIREGVFLCGDYRETPSIQGALASGRRAAESVLREIS